MRDTDKKIVSPQSSYFRYKSCSILYVHLSLCLSSSHLSYFGQFCIYFLFILLCQPILYSTLLLSFFYVYLYVDLSLSLSIFHIIVVLFMLKCLLLTQCVSHSVCSVNTSQSLFLFSSFKLYCLFFLYLSACLFFKIVCVLFMLLSLPFSLSLSVLLCSKLVCSFPPSTYPSQRMRGN